MLDTVPNPVFDTIPTLSDIVVPPTILGAATLVTAAMHGAATDVLSGLINQSVEHPAAQLYDISVLFLVAQRRSEALDLQRDAIAGSSLFRIRREGPAQARLRVLALVSPGDMMANTPLDFITNNLDIQLDLLFMTPDKSLPQIVPDHDVMFFAASEPDAATLDRMARLYQSWPRPVLNNPALLPKLARDSLPSLLASTPGICSPKTIEVSRNELDAAVAQGAGIVGLPYPVIIRPHGSHAGDGLEKIDDPSALAAYAAGAEAALYYVTAFAEYRAADGLYRKYRVAFIDRKPHLCHLAASENWMVHYLNAGMTEDIGKRDDEADAMANFDTEFAARHQAAFETLHTILPFDYYSIDCSELPDGRLLVFEADTAAIIHNMDCPEMFAYKHTQMRRVFDAFANMLDHRSNPALGSN